MLRRSKVNRKQIRVLASALATVSDRFPDRTETITHLAKKNKGFQTLCNDYRKCRLARRYWTQSEEDGAEDRREEYEDVQRELEAEIIRYLEEFER